MINSYSDLQAKIIAWLAQQGLTVFTDQVTTFIQLAEKAMNNDLKARELLVLLPEATLDTEFKDLPADFNRMRTIQKITTDSQGKKSYDPMKYVNEDDFARQFALNVAQYYTVYGTQVRFKDAPTGSESPPLGYDISYYKKVPPLTDSETSNEILVAYPQTYLYASLLQAEGFNVNDERIWATWKRLYDEDVFKINELSDDRHGTAAVSWPY